MSKDNKSSLLALIPEIYYDLISRVTPGTIFILALVILKDKCLFLNILENLKGIGIGAASVILVLFLATSYFFGMLFYTLSGSLIKSRVLNINNYAWKQVRNDAVLIELIYKSLKLDATKKPLLQKEPQEFERYIYGYIKAKDTNLGSIIVKMRAEAFLFSSLIVGFFVLFLLALLAMHPISEWELEKIIPAITLLIQIVLSYFALRNRLKSYVERSCVCIHIISGMQKR